MFDALWVKGSGVRASSKWSCRGTRGWEMGMYVVKIRLKRDLLEGLRRLPLVMVREPEILFGYEKSTSRPYSDPLNYGAALCPRHSSGGAA